MEKFIMVHARNKQTGGFGDAILNTDCIENIVPGKEYLEQYPTGDVGSIIFTGEPSGGCFPVKETIAELWEMLR